jgi:hypothetical protein
VAVAEVIVAIVAALVLPRLERDYGWSIGLTYDASRAQATLGAIPAENACMRVIQILAEV